MGGCSRKSLSFIYATQQYSVLFQLVPWGYYRSLHTVLAEQVPDRHINIYPSDSDP